MTGHQLTGDRQPATAALALLGAAGRIAANEPPEDRLSYRFGHPGAGVTNPHELLGGATSADAHHITAPAPGGVGAVRCIHWALRDAKVDRERVGYVNAHGTSTPANDPNETLAFKAVWGSAAAVPPVSSTKSMTGHMLGAAGGVEAIATVQALHHGVLPPTRNLHDPDPDLDLDSIPHTAREQRVDVALSTNFAFGGQNATVVFWRV